MNTQFFCKNKDRGKKVGTPGSTINGIDYLEIASVDQKTIKLFFYHNLPGQSGGVPANPPLKKENIFIEGGVRVKNITVDNISATNNVLTIIVKSAGDFSTYRLKIGTSSTDQDTPPPGFDQQLSSVDFSFKINCPNEFDCKTDDDCPRDHIEEPDIDYLAKDYSSFKRLMLDRLSIIMPDWKERNAADLEIALIELLAYVGDHLSYYQDAVATEAYLHTARRRVSLKRHARLLDYYVHDGCNARVWAQVQVDKGGGAEGALLEIGTVLMTNGDEEQKMIPGSEIEKFVNERDPVVFETMHDIALNSAHNLISFYTWEDSNCCLPKGATRATLLDSWPESPSEPLCLTLKKGDVLVFEELYDPKSGKKADANRYHRHAVRLKNVESGLVDELTKARIVNIEWYEEDALPFALVLTSSAPNDDKDIPLNEKSVARGNIVLADQGYTKEDENLSPAAAVDDQPYYPRIARSNNTVRVVYDHELEMTHAASRTIQQNPHDALHAIALQEGNEVWEPKKDLLGSDRFATEFVVELEQDGISYVRFGDDKAGRKPISGFSPKATYRIGNGLAGNIGANTLNVVEWDTSGVRKVINLLPASGGMEAETMEEVRQFAPQAFRTQERAVTAADYVQKTELHAEVQKAAAKFYWTGSWYTVYIIIDRKDGREIDEAFKESIRLHLEQYRMAGYDLEIRPPRFVPLQIVMNVCVKEGYFKNEVKKSLLQVFGNGEGIDGKQGFFHPDNFTFGQALYLSAIYKEAMAIAGVASVEIIQFKRWTKNQGMEIKDGILKPGELEILRLDNDPNFPENGRIEFIMLGGL